MKHHLKRQFQRFVSHRPYQFAAASAAALVLASTNSTLFTQTGDAPARQDAPATVAELNSRTDGVASRGQERTSVSPSTGASTSAASPSAEPNPDLTTKPAAVKPPSLKVLDYEYQEQINYYYCGPAATRIALTVQSVNRGQDDLAGRLRTTEYGTDSAEDTTRVLNSLMGRDVYQTRTIPGAAATPAEMDRLQADVVRAVGDGHAIVANIAGSATDTAGGWHSFPGGHYLTVVGYRDDGRTVKIADPANAATAAYWMTTIDLANWIAQRGYSA